MNNQPYRWGIFLADLDPTVGSEQRGIRPVLVVSSELVNKYFGTVTVIPLTSRKPGRQIYSNEVLVSRGTAGIKVDSIVLGHQIRAIAKRRLQRRLGSLIDWQLRQRVQRAILTQLDF